MYLLFFHQSDSFLKGLVATNFFLFKTGFIETVFFFFLSVEPVKVSLRLWDGVPVDNTMYNQ